MNPETKDKLKGDDAVSDADGNMIPLVEDDQGEGIKDFFDGELMLVVILDRLTALERKFEHVFGNHVLIGGQFKSLCFEPDTNKGK